MKTRLTNCQLRVLSFLILIRPQWNANVSRSNIGTISKSCLAIYVSIRFKHTKFYLWYPRNIRIRVCFLWLIFNQTKSFWTCSSFIHCWCASSAIMLYTDINHAYTLDSYLLSGLRTASHHTLCVAVHCAVVAVIRMERANRASSLPTSIVGLSFDEALFYTLRVRPFWELCGMRKVKFRGRIPCIFMFDCFQYQWFSFE